MNAAGVVESVREMYLDKEVYPKDEHDEPEVGLGGLWYRDEQVNPGVPIDKDGWPHGE